MDQSQCRSCDTSRCYGTAGNSGSAGRDRPAHGVCLTGSQLPPDEELEQNRRKISASLKINFPSHLDLSKALDMLLNRKTVYRSNASQSPGTLPDPRKDACVTTALPKPAALLPRCFLWSLTSSLSCCSRNLSLLKPLCRLSLDVGD